MILHQTRDYTCHLSRKELITTTKRQITIFGTKLGQTISPHANTLLANKISEKQKKMVPTLQIKSTWSNGRSTDLNSLVKTKL